MEGKSNAIYALLVYCCSWRWSVEDQADVANFGEKMRLFFGEHRFDVLTREQGLTALKDEHKFSHVVIVGDENHAEQIEQIFEMPNFKDALKVLAVWQRKPELPITTHDDIIYIGKVVESKDLQPFRNLFGIENQNLSHKRAKTA